MPYKLTKTTKGYGVYNIDKKEWKSFNTTKDKAEKQLRLLHYIDARKYSKK